MSRAKEAVVILLDVGASMCLPLRERLSVGGKNQPEAGDGLQHTRFAAAVTAVENVIQQKLFFQPKDEVGIIAYGSDETDNQLNEEQGDNEYRNVQVVNSIDTPTLHMIKRLRELRPSKSVDTKVDILDGIIVALDLLFRRTDGKKYDKRLMIITDAVTTIADTSDLESIVTMIGNMEVKLQVIGLDFQHTTLQLNNDMSGDKVSETAMKGEDVVKDEPMDVAVQDDSRDNTVKDEPMETESTYSSRIKAENEKMLVSIANEVGGEVSSVTKRMELLAQGMKKTVALTTKFRGPLEFGNALGIPVYCYLKTKKATLPTLSKESQASFEKETAGRVKLDRRYTSPQNIDQEVPPDEQVKAYRYGSEKVPFASADVEFFKFQTEKSLKVLGFLNRSQINHAMFVAATDIFVAEPFKPHAATCFAALIDAMVELDQVIIARFVPRKNAAPKIVALIPHAPSSGKKEENFYAMWSQQLPFEEDLRNYEFAPLKTPKYTPSDEQQLLADKLVDSLSIRDDKINEVGVCFNPIIRRFFHAVSVRALDDSARIPPLPAYLDASLKMDPVRQEKISELIKNFGDAFQLKEAVQKAKDRKKKSFWSDVPTASIKEEDLLEEHEEAGENEGSDLELDLDDLLDSGNITSVGSMNPIADFEALVELSQSKASRRPQLTIAVTGMETQIEKFLSQNNSEFYPKALQCLAHFRKRSVDIQYATQFNDFLTKLRKSLSEDSNGWKTVKDADISLLSSLEDPSLDVSPAEARAFLYGEEEVDVNLAAASLSSQVEAMEEADDMFADFE